MRRRRGLTSTQLNIQIRCLLLSLFDSLIFHDEVPLTNEAVLPVTQEPSV
jgi:hypothetical protein